MKTTDRNRSRRRHRLLVWYITRAKLLSIALAQMAETIKSMSPPQTLQLKFAERELTAEERAQRIAMPIVTVEVKAKPMPPYDPVPTMLRYIADMMIPRPR
jgi:hypothetical protein